MKILIDKFKGIIPGITPSRLPDNFAQTAANCVLDKQTLRPVGDLNTDTTFAAPGALRSLYKYDDIWLYWTESDINALRLQLAASDDRVMYTGDGYPKQVDSNLMAASGIPTVDAATITNITKAPQAVVTAAAHGFSNADVVGIHSVAGMTTVNGKNFTVANKADNTFELAGIDSTTYDAYTSGGQAVKARDHRRVGIPAPTTGCTVSNTGAGDGKIKYTVAYVYTFVVKWSDGTEEESPPSPASEILDVEGNEYVRIDTTDAYTPTMLAGGNNITHVRVYRIAVGISSAIYRHVKMRDTSVTETTLFWYDIPVANWVVGNSLYDSNGDGSDTDLWDNSADSAIETTNWDNPPSGLSGLIQYQNGILAGFSGRKVCISEPFVFYAWPSEYQLQVDYDIVALGVYNRSLVVGTDAYPYIIYGTNALTLGKDRLPFSQACLSARGMISTEVGVIYPCPDGLFLINYSDGWGGTLVSKGIITKEDWEALPPTGKTFADLTSFYYDGMYFGFFNGTDDGFVFNFKDNPFFTTLQLVKNIYHGLIDEEDDDLILLTNTGGANYYADEFNRSTSDLTFKWKSKDFQTPCTSMSACRIRGSQSTTSPLILIPYGDGTQLQRKHVASSELPTAIASWDLDGDGLDGIASYDATLHGGGWGAGPSGYALDLDGTDDYADTSETFQSLFQASFGIELMFNTDDGQPSADKYLFGFTDAGVNNYCWGRITPNGYMSFAYSADGDSATVTPSAATLSNGLSGWQHVVFTINTVTSLAYAYLNGSLLKSVSIAGITMGDYAQNTNDLIFGANNYQGTPVGFLDGRIANVRLYDAAISAAQALALYNNIWFKEVTDEKMFRLPGVGLPESHEYEVLGTTEVESITIATSPEEL